MRSGRLRVLPFLAAALLASCDGCDYKLEERIEAASWADDDSEIAFVIFRYEYLQGFLNYQTRHERYELFAENADGTNRRLIRGPVESDWPLNAGLYYMKRRGYLVLVTFDSVWSRSDLIRINSGTRFGLDSTTWTERQACYRNFQQAVPSPSGATIAIAQQVACVPFVSGTPQPTTTRLLVRFLDDATLAEVRRDTVEAPIAPPGYGSWQYTWRPQGDFVVWFDSTSFSLAPDRAPLTASVPTCLGPRTTSSYISSTGLVVGAEGLTLVTRPSTATRFGCPTP